MTESLGWLAAAVFTAILAIVTNKQHERLLSVAAGGEPVSKRKRQDRAAARAIAGLAAMYFVVRAVTAFT